MNENIVKEEEPVKNIVKKTMLYLMTGRMRVGPGTAFAETSPSDGS